MPARARKVGGKKKKERAGVDKRGKGKKSRRGLEGRKKRKKKGKREKPIAGLSWIYSL